MAKLDDEDIAFRKLLIRGGILAVLGLVFCTALGMYGCPRYGVWEREMKGKGELAQAQSNRTIAVLEAQARLDSAKLEADAEVERAKGVAKANAIIGESLSGHEEYLRYLWITNLEAGAGRETIYVPTEAGLPVLEATRRLDK